MHISHSLIKSACWNWASWGWMPCLLKSEAGWQLLQLFHFIIKVHAQRIVIDMIATNGSTGPFIVLRLPKAAAVKLIKGESRQVREIPYSMLQLNVSSRHED